MAEYTVLPQTLDLSFVRGDEFGILVDASIDLTGYSFTSKIYKVTNVTNGIITGTEDIVNFTITVVDLATGQINLSLQESQTLSLNPQDKLRWYLRWVAPGVITRTVLSGKVTVGDP